MTNTGQSLAFQGHGGLGNDEEASMYRYGPYTPKSLERFILKLSRRLKEGSNVVLRVPSPNLNQDFLKTIQRVVKDSAGPELIPLDASKRKDSKSLHAFLNLELSSKRQARRQKSLEALFQSDNGHSAVYMITGLDSWIEPAKKKAASELSEVAANTLGHASKGKASGQRPGGYLFLAIVDPLFPLPDKNLGLTILDWWGVTSPSDHEFMFEGIMADHNPPHSQDMYWWLKAMSFSVGGDDPLLIGSIVREAPLTLIDVKGLLLSHPLAKEKLATDHFPKDLLFRNLSPDPGSPPERPSERRLWAAGLLAPNRYSLYHPVMLARDDKILEKIIAMGQREVFFPLTDQVHAFISYAVEEI
ncbi:MAG: hypothetical protein LBF40_07515, partial [Deltaproteobacteria bacterium]|nr:hypothetical protein [Deltaproteobacteria bacterium]